MPMSEVDETTARAAAIIARRKPAAAIGESAPVIERVLQVWPVELADVVAGMMAERERCAMIVESLVGGANGPETDAVLTTAAEAIRSGEGCCD
jgi:hypothetical protein